MSVAQEQILQSFGIAWFPAVRSVGGVCLVKEGKTVDVAGHEIPDVGSGIPRVTRHYFDQHQPVDHLILSATGMLVSPPTLAPGITHWVGSV